MKGCLKKCGGQRPDIVEITALVSVLHSFYNGLENIFLTVAKRIDKDVPTGTQWHRDLLYSMIQSTSNRAAVLSDELSLQLTDYLGFRHFYRHSYSFILECEKLEELVIPLPDIWQRAREELQIFLANLTKNTLDGTECLNF